MTPCMTLVRCFAIVTFGVAAVFAQASNPTPSTAGGATAILRAAKTVFIQPKSGYLNQEALERELANHLDFSQVGLMIVRNKKEADLILEVSRKKWTTRFIVTTLNARTGVLIASCRESSLGGEIEPKLAKCFIKQAKAARQANAQSK